MSAHFTLDQKQSAAPAIPAVDLDGLIKQAFIGFANPNTKEGARVAVSFLQLLPKEMQTEILSADDVVRNLAFNYQGTAVLDFINALPDAQQKKVLSAKGAINGLLQCSMDVEKVDGALHLVRVFGRQNLIGLIEKHFPEMAEAPAGWARARFITKTGTPVSNPPADPVLPAFNSDQKELILVPPERMSVQSGHHIRVEDYFPLAAE
jgi:hypothetical protein